MVNGTSGIGAGGIGLPGFPLRPGASEEKRAPVRAGVPQGPAAPAAPPNAVPAEAPAGTDPALWAVLTGEERAFFARFQSLGPLTYGPQAPGATRTGGAMPRGARLDVTV